MGQMGLTYKLAVSPLPICTYITCLGSQWARSILRPKIKHACVAVPTEIYKQRLEETYSL
jgi:hypothetical protein